MLSLLVRGLDTLQGEENCFYGTLLPILVTILKKTKAINFQFTAMTTALGFSLEDASYIYNEEICKCNLLYHTVSRE